ncbi:MAG: DNA-processing protein DprA [Candidatus Cloacimonetes bacterium]|nr:DNA-processing protein DprA [Candidatus Cloacimonadota bacterium]
MKRIKAWLQLLAAPEIGNAKTIKLAETFGEPAEFLGNSGVFEIENISEKTKEFLKNPAEPKGWERAKKLIEKFEIKFVSILDDNYPQMLRNIYDPPPFLFYRGNLNKEDLRRTIAIVGTRKASPYGKQMVQEIGMKLSQAGFTIISGLAYGIDAIAHMSALNQNGKTYAVMGTGVDQIYPPENREIADEIIKTGAIMSEYVPGSRAEKWNFPTRNRIISGLSLGSFIIEGSRKSGALLTAKFAMDQNRDVFALPGDINRPQAEGPNYLIKLGAKIVSCAQDILEEYDLILDEQTRLFPELTRQEDKIYQILLNNKPEMHFDNLLVASGLNIGELSSILLNLELKNVIKKTPGNKIVAMY